MIVEIRIPNQVINRDEFLKLKQLIDTDIEEQTPDELFVYLSTEERETCTTTGASEDEALTLKKIQRAKTLAEAGQVSIKENWRNYIVDINILLTECPTLKFEVLKRLSTLGTSEAITETLTRVLDLVDKYTKATDTFNEKCNSHIGGNELMQIRRVYVQTDYCTENLQARLDEGWRILAVCVQQDQRRPDYVLGMESGVVDS